MLLYVSLQVDNPSMRWQMALYKEMAGKAEDADAPEKVVKRVQEVSAVLYHIEVVSFKSIIFLLVWCVGVIVTQLIVYCTIIQDLLLPKRIVFVYSDRTPFQV